MEDQEFVSDSGLQGTKVFFKGLKVEDKEPGRLAFLWVQGAIH